MIPPDAESVLVQDDWLRRMARQLVRDPELADDLVQDAWVAGLERGRTHRAERPWLAGVLRNRGRALFRARTRRLAREARVAPMDDAPPTDDVVAQLQLRERASHAMLELEEPYRTAVYLAYAQGVGVREAAKREGVAPSTMSERVREGVARLRRRIDDAYDGDRRAWVTALVPLARPRGLAALGAGGAAMLASAVLVTGLFAGGLSLARRGSAPDLEEVATSTSTAGGAARASGQAEGETGLAAVPPSEAPRELLAASAPVHAATTPAAGATAQEPEAGVSGRFLLPDGAPAAGATWRLHGFVANDDRVREHGLPDDWTDPTGTLDVDGRIKLRFDPPQAFRFTLSVEFEDHVVHRWRWSGIGPSMVKDVGTVEFRPGGTVTGRVLDADGNPLAGTAWALHAEEVGAKPPMDRQLARASTRASSADASFTLRRLPEGVSRIQVYDRSFGWSKEHSVSVVAGQTVTRDVVLDEPDSAAGRIGVSIRVETYRSLLVGGGVEDVSLVAENGSRTTGVRDPNRVDAYVFEGVGPGEFRVEIDDPRFEPWSRDGVRAGAQLSAHLRGCSGLQLDVRDESGVPVELYSVEVELEGALRMPRRFHPVDGSEPLPEGRLMGLVPHDYLITVRADAGIAAARVPGLGVAETRPISLTLRPATTASGVVVHPDGTPAEGAVVRLVAPAEIDDGPGVLVATSQVLASAPERLRKELARTYAGVDGSFELPIEIRGEAFVLVGEAPGPTAESGRFDTSDAAAPTDLELTVPRGGRLEGRVVAPDGIELAGRTVLVWTPSIAFLPVPRAMLDGDGRFELGPLAADAAQVFVLKGSRWSSNPDGSPAGAIALGGVQLVEGETVTAIFDYPALDPATLRIDLSSSGLESEPVTAVVRGGVHGTPVVVAGPANDLEAITLEPDTYQLWFGGDGWLARADDVEAGAGESVDLSVDLGLSTRCVRFLVDGAPLAKTSIRVTSAPDEVAGSRRVTDGDGWLELRLGRGSYSFWIESMDKDLLLRAASVTWPLPNGTEEIVFD
ncbi:MAG: sigma factor [Planctomycetota bacterium]